MADNSLIETMGRAKYITVSSAADCLITLLAQVELRALVGLVHGRSARFKVQETHSKLTVT